LSYTTETNRGQASLGLPPVNPPSKIPEGSSH